VGAAGRAETSGEAGGVTSGSICCLGWRRMKLNDDSFFFGLLMVRERQKRFIVGMVAYQDGSILYSTMSGWPV